MSQNLCVYTLPGILAADKVSEYADKYLTVDENCVICQELLKSLKEEPENLLLCITMCCCLQNPIVKAPNGVRQKQNCVKKVIEEANKESLKLSGRETIFTAEDRYIETGKRQYDMAKGAADRITDVVIRKNPNYPAYPNKPTPTISGVPGSLEDAKQQGNIARIVEMKFGDLVTKSQDRQSPAAQEAYGEIAGGGPVTVLVAGRAPKQPNEKICPCKKDNKEEDAQAQELNMPVPMSNPADMMSLEKMREMSYTVNEAGLPEFRPSYIRQGFDLGLMTTAAGVAPLGAMYGAAIVGPAMMGAPIEAAVTASPAAVNTLSNSARIVNNIQRIAPSPSNSASVLDGTAKAAAAAGLLIPSSNSTGK